MYIRQATIQDIEQLIPLFDGYRVFYRKTTDLEGARAFLSERLTKKDSTIYIAFAKPVLSGVEVADSDKAIGFTQLYPIFSSAFSLSVSPSGSGDQFVPYDEFTYNSGKLVDIQVTVDLDGLVTDTNCAWNCAHFYFFVKDGWGLLGTQIPIGARSRGAIETYYEDGTVDLHSFCTSGDAASDTNRVSKVIFREVPLPEHMCYEATFDVNGRLVDSTCSDDFSAQVYVQDNRVQMQNHYYCMRESWSGLVIVDPVFEPKAQTDTFRGTDAESTTSGSLSAGAIAGLIIGFLVTVCACFAAGSACTLLYTRRQRKVTQATAVRSSGRGGTHRGGVSRSVSGHLRH